MNINFRHMIPANLGENSHVWVYQSNRVIDSGEALQIGQVLQKFTKRWKSRGVQVRGYANVFFEHFIVFIADESATTIGGFSTTGMIRVVKNIEKNFQLELFDRLMLAFVIQERIQLLPLSQLNPSIEKDFITPDTLYFNNTILTKKELMNNWIVPLKNSWLGMRVPEEKEVEIEC